MCALAVSLLLSVAAGAQSQWEDAYLLPDIHVKYDTAIVKVQVDDDEALAFKSRIEFQFSKSKDFGEMKLKHFYGKTRRGTNGLHEQLDEMVDRGFSFDTTRVGSFYLAELKASDLDCMDGEELAYAQMLGILIAFPVDSLGAQVEINGACLKSEVPGLRKAMLHVLSNIETIPLPEIDKRLHLPLTTGVVDSLVTAKRNALMKKYRDQMLKKRHCYADDYLIERLKREYPEGMIDSLVRFQRDEELARLYAETASQSDVYDLRKELEEKLGQRFTYTEYYHLDSLIDQQSFKLQDYLGYYYTDDPNNPFVRAEMLELSGRNSYFSGLDDDEKSSKLQNFSASFFWTLTKEVFNNEKLTNWDMDNFRRGNTYFSLMRALSEDSTHVLFKLIRYRSLDGKQWQVEVFGLPGDGEKWNSTGYTLWNGPLDMLVFSRNLANDYEVVMFDAQLNFESMKIWRPRIWERFPGSILTGGMKCVKTLYDVYPRNWNSEVNKPRINESVMHQVYLNHPKDDDFKKYNPALESSERPDTIPDWQFSLPKSDVDHFFAVGDTLWMKDQDLAYLLRQDRKASEKVWTSDYISDDIDHNGTMDLFYFAISNGKVIDAVGWYVKNGRIEPFNTKKLMKLCDKTIAARNLKLYSLMEK